MIPMIVFLILVMLLSTIIRSPSEAIFMSAVFSDIYNNQQKLQQTVTPESIVPCGSNKK